MNKHLKTSIIILGLMGNILSVYARDTSLDSFLTDSNTFKNPRKKIYSLRLKRNGDEFYYHGKAMKFFDMEVHEVNLTFSQNKLRKTYLLLGFTKKSRDQEKQIKQISRTLCSKLNDLTHQSPQRDKYTFKNNESFDTYFWEYEGKRIYVYSRTENPGAFVSINIESTDFSDRKLEDKLTTTICNKPATPLNGRILLHVPMRCQLKDMGGCWFATITRQLAYLGSEIEQMMVFVAMQKGEDNGIKALSKEYGFKHDKISFQSSNNAINDSERLIVKYNKLANKRGVPEIKCKIDSKNVKCWNEEFSKMNPEILKKIDINKREYKKFKDILHKYIDKGIPISWTIKRHNGKGKHRRLIVGVNWKNDSIYFSDSWRVHEVPKQMPIKAACCMTVWMQVFYKK